MSLKLKQNDTAPFARATLYSDMNASTVLNLTTATAVKFNMKPKSGGSPKVSGAAAVKTNSPGTDGKVHYVWLAADTNQVGTFDCEFEVTWGDGTKQTFPPDGYLSVEIVAEINT